MVHNSKLVDLKAALSCIEKSLELKSQTGKIKNIMSSNDFDEVISICMKAVKILSKDLSKDLYLKPSE